MYDYLEHHGIKGQKWGVRRYQNYDGTLTNTGKKRSKNDRIYEKERQIQKYRGMVGIGDLVVGAGGTIGVLGGIGMMPLSVLAVSLPIEAAGFFVSRHGDKKLDELLSNKKVKSSKKSISDKYIDAFDKKAATYQDRADRKRAEGKKSKQIFEKAAQRREAHVKTTLEDKARAERLTRNISDNNKIKKTYLKGFDNKAARYQDRADRKRAEGEQSEKIFEKAAQRREAHVKTTLEDKERAKKMLKKK